MQETESDTKENPARRPSSARVGLLQTVVVAELVAAIVALIAWHGSTHEWREAWSAGWGPVILIADSAPGNQLGGIVFFVGCIAALVVGVRQFPKWWSLLLVAGSVFVWIFLGVVGMGIGC